MRVQLMEIHQRDPRLTRFGLGRNPDRASNHDPLGRTMQLLGGTFENLPATDSVNTRSNMARTAAGLSTRDSRAAPLHPQGVPNPGSHGLTLARPQLPLRLDEAVHHQRIRKLATR